MRRIVPGIFVMVLVLAAACGDDESPAISMVHSDLARMENPLVPAGDAASLQEGNARFAFDLYRVLSREDEGNLFFSPHSISTALAMTYAGARGETEQEMASTLHFELPQDRLHAAFNGLDQALAERSRVQLPEDADGDPPELHVANAIWGDREYRFLDAFLDVLALNYGAGLQLLDFRGDPEGSRQTINDWVEEQTNGRIQDLIPEGAIDVLTRLVLTNAIYFKASWLSPFDADATAPAPFHPLDGGASEVQMMHVRNAEARYAQLGDLQAVELPYVGKQISMVVLVPDEGSFAETQNSLDAEGLAEVVGALSPVSLTLAMPKFEFEWEMSLKQPLQDLGMASAFDETADLSGMDGSRNLVITDVVHKAFVSVDEQGTEAAAATAVIVGETSAPPSVELTVDRPFIFLLRDEPTGAILFLGQLVAPAASQD